METYQFLMRDGRIFNKCSPSLIDAILLLLIEEKNCTQQNILVVHKILTIVF